MRRHRRTTVLMAMLPSLVVLVGVHVASPQSSDDTQAIEEMYAARLQRFQSAPTPIAMSEAYVEDVAEDAVWMPPNAPPVRGKTQVRQWGVEFFGKYVLEIDSQEIESLAVGSEIAVRRFVSAGDYVERENGVRTSFDQKYVDVLRKEADGTWKLILHMWSSNNDEPSIWK